MLQRFLEVGLDDLALPPRSPAPADLRRDIFVAPLRASVRGLLAALRRRHEIRRLERLPDRLLADVGLTRAEVERAAARYPF